MTNNIDEFISRFESNAEFERQNGSLQGCLEFLQFAEWFKELRQMRKAIEDIKTEIDKLHKVGNANDGRVYVPINDVFDVIDKHINEVGTSKSLPEGSKE